MIPFATIRARAEKRKGGAEALARLLPPKRDAAALARLGDDRVLAEMTKRVFSAGFAWSVIEARWPGFEAAFLGKTLETVQFQALEHALSKKFFRGDLREKRWGATPAKGQALPEKRHFTQVTLPCTHMYIYRPEPPKAIFRTWTRQISSRSLLLGPQSLADPFQDLAFFGGKAVHAHHT